MCAACSSIFASCWSIFIIIAWKIVIIAEFSASVSPGATQASTAFPVKFSFPRSFYILDLLYHSAGHLTPSIIPLLTPMSRPHLPPPHVSGQALTAGQGRRNLTAWAAKHSKKKHIAHQMADKAHTWFILCSLLSKAVYITQEDSDMTSHTGQTHSKVAHS